MRTYGFLATFVMSLCMVHTAVCGGEEESWIDSLVVSKVVGESLHVGDRAVATSQKLRIYRVKQVQGEWLWLEYGDLKGWILKQNVVKESEAPGFFTEMIRQKPGDRSLYMRRGEFYEGKPDCYDLAIADFSVAIALDPSDPVAFHKRGFCYRMKKEEDKANSDFNESIRLGPNNAGTFCDRGIAWENKREYRRALADFDAAIVIAPSYAYAHQFRAWLLATCPDDEIRNGRSALSSALRAVELSEPSFMFTRLSTLAACYAEIGDFKSAIENQKKAIKLFEDKKISDKIKAQWLDEQNKYLTSYRKGMPVRE